MTVQGRVSTPNASRYLQQVCKHWGHRFTSTFDSEHGTVDFGDGTTVDLVAHPDELELVIRCAPESAAILQEIVEEHVLRFAHKEGAIEFQWSTLASPQ